jgi:beta-lactamase class A
MSKWTDRLWRVGLFVAIGGLAIVVALQSAFIWPSQVPTSVAATGPAVARVTSGFNSLDPADAVPTGVSEVEPLFVIVMETPALDSPGAPAEESLTSDLTEQPGLLSLAEVIEMTIAEVDGTWGIAFRDLDTGETYLHNGDDYFPSASLYKLLAMYALFLDDVQMTETIVLGDRHFVEAGEDEPLYPGQTVSVAEALELMITVSSNAAAHALAERVGWNRLNEVSLELGLEQTGVPVGARGARYDDWRSEMSSTSPSDMLFIFSELADGRLVNAEASEEMLDVLRRQQIRDRLPALLPEDVLVAHKTGNLPGIVNDGGIISGPDGRFVLIALSRDVDEIAATDAIARLAQRLHELIAMQRTPRQALP